MDDRTLANITSKVEQLKQKKARAEGGMETVTKDWKARYDLNTLEEAQAKEVSVNEQMVAVDKETEEYFAELVGLANWNLI